MIKDYAIIDHVGSIDEDVSINAVYRKIYLKATKDGFQKDTTFKMKEICKAESPYAREITDKMKLRVRHTKNPKRVYFICPELNYYTERELKKWYDRCIDVTVYEANHNFIYNYETVYDTLKYNFHSSEASINDRICEMWGPAFGYEFNAPITRVDNVLVPDNYCKRPDHDKIVNTPETHFTKPLTKCERFFEYNCTCESDKRKKEFLQKFAYFLKLTGCTIDLTLGATFGAVTGNVKSLNEFLEIDYTICTECGRPRNTRNHKDKYGNSSLNAICPHCETEFDSDVQESSTYYDDSYTDDYENIEDAYFDNEYLILDCVTEDRDPDDVINHFEW